LDWFLQIEGTNSTHFEPRLRRLVRLWRRGRGEKGRPAWHGGGHSGRLGRRGKLRARRRDLRGLRGRGAKVNGDWSRRLPYGSSLLLYIFQVLHICIVPNCLLSHTLVKINNSCIRRYKYYFSRFISALYNFTKKIFPLSKPYV
jgi:hypothetical protein